jgi:uncharacterized protein YraI
MKRFLSHSITTLAVLTITSIALAQDLTCPDITVAALQSSDTDCVICPDAATLTPSLDNSTPNILMDTNGNSVDLATVKRLRVASDSDWGVGLLTVRANIPQGAATYLLYGHVVLDNQSEVTTSSGFVPLTVQVISPSGANVRSAPSATAERLAQLYTGDTVTATGRMADNAWVRVLLADGMVGWVSSSLIITPYDLSLLEVVKDTDSERATLYGPMQAFTVQSQPNDAPCSDDPSSGLLIQVPLEAGKVEFLINGALVLLRGTAFFQAQAGANLVISVLEGEADVTSNGATQTVSDQERVRIPVDDALKVNAPPGELEAYDYVHLRNLPFDLLPHSFEMPFSLHGAATPVPVSDPLIGLDSNSPCTIAWAGAVNVRFGPGTDFPIRMGVDGGFRAQPDARSQGSDGRLWFRLGDGIWLSSDVIVAAGNCGHLPLIPAPPVTTP